MKPQRIIRPITAFSVASAKQRRPRQEDKEHLSFLRGLHCCLCGAPGPDAAHIRAASPIHGKQESGLQRKPDDKWVVPLCRAHHDEQHASGDELKFWTARGLDPFGLALSLYAASGDDEVAEAILQSNRMHLKERT